MADPDQTPSNVSSALDATVGEDADGAWDRAAETPAHCRHAEVPDPTLTREEAESIAELFKVLGDPTRVLVLRTLSDAGELCVRHLAEAVGMSQSSVSHHLRILRATALVRARREGREVYYRPDDEHVDQLIDVCAEHVVHAGSPRGRTREGVDG